MYIPEFVSQVHLFTPDNILFSSSVAFLGICCFVFGFFIALRVTRASGLGRRLYTREGFLAPYFITVILSLTIFFYAVTIYGIDTMIFDRTKAYRGAGILLFSTNSLLVLSCVFGLLAYSNTKSKRIIVFQAIFILIMSVGSRSLLALFLLAYFYISIDYGSLAKRIVFSVFGFLLLLGIFVILPAIRQPADSDFIPVWLMFRIVANSFQEGEFFNIAVSWLDNSSFKYGEVFFHWIYIFMPRAFFPDKPVVWGKEVYQYALGLRDEGLASTSYAFGQLTELYLPFGLIGVILGMFLWGLLFGFIEKKISTAKDFRSLYSVSYLCIFFGIFWIVRHGVLGLIQYSILLMPILFIVLIITRSFRLIRGGDF